MSWRVAALLRYFLFIFRVPRNLDHILKNGLLHVCSPATGKVNEAKHMIKQNIQENPLDYVTQNYEKCVADVLDQIRSTG